jgi:hypothetical protein
MRTHNSRMRTRGENTHYTSLLVKIHKQVASRECSLIDAELALDDNSPSSSSNSVRVQVVEPSPTSHTFLQVHCEICWSLANATPLIASSTNLTKLSRSAFPTTNFFGAEALRPLSLLELTK